MLRRTFTLGLALALGGCMEIGDGGAARTTDWQGPMWYLMTIDGAAFPPSGPPKANVSFDAEHFSYGGFCNAVSGEYSYGPGDRFVTGEGFATMIGCMDPNEDVFFAAMRKVDRLRMDGQDLLLLTSDGQELRFAPQVL